MKPRFLKRKTLATVLLIAVTGVLAAGIYLFTTRDPTPIQLDPSIYDDYAGYYDFGNTFIVTIRREGDRLMAYTPEHLPQQLFPETKARFFVKGQPDRTTFHRDVNGQVDYATWEWKKVQEKAERKSALSPPLECTTAMVAATTGGKAKEAGLAILKEGGTAADAAMAIALCEVVHAGGSYVSFAGPMMMMYYDASASRVYYLDAQFNTPLGEKNPRSIPKRGGRSALVPGFMAGVQAAHDRFGKLPFRRLFEPAIAQAENGEAVSAAMAWWIDSKKSVLSRLPETKRVFTRPDGKYYVRGDWLRQPELAATLKNVAAQGASYMYDGAWGQRFAEAIQRNGGKITVEDMKNYKAVWEDPLQTTYRDYRVYAPGLSAWGGVNTIEGLNLLELAGLRQHGHYTNAPQSSARPVAEIARDQGDLRLDLATNAERHLGMAAERDEKARGLESHRRAGCGGPMGQYGGRQSYD